MSSSSSSIKKEGLLLMNFKPSAAFKGSSEREALYHLAGRAGIVGRPLLQKQHHHHHQQQHNANVDHGDTVAFGDFFQSGESSFAALASVEPRFYTSWPEGDMVAYYRTLASFHFTMSPRGNGLDCFRTWEALSLGVVPIVKKSGPFDEIYNGLPVLLVDRWSDVNASLLRRTLDHWGGDGAPNFDRLPLLSWRHWVAPAAAR